MSMDGRYQQARVIFWGKLQLMPADSPARRVFEWSMLEYAQSDAADRRIHEVNAEDGWMVTRAPTVKHGLIPWCSQLREDLFQLGLRSAYENPVGALAVGISAWKRTVKSAVLTREQHRWWNRMQLRPMLRTYITLKSGPQSMVREWYLTVPHGGWNDQRLAGRRLLTRLRSGNNELRINTVGMVRQSQSGCVRCAQQTSRPRRTSYWTAACMRTVAQRCTIPSTPWCSPSNQLSHHMYHFAVVHSTDPSSSRSCPEDCIPASSITSSSVGC